MSSCLEHSRCELSEETTEVMTLPATVTRHLAHAVTAQRSPVLLKVTSDGRLLSWQGALHQYGLQSLQTLVPIARQLVFLEGLFPLQQDRDVLPCLQTQDGMVADVHLFCDGEQSWVLLLDASDQAEQMTRLQQKGNDLNLLRHQYSKLLHRFLEQSLTEDSGQPEMVSFGAPSSTIQERTISVLLIKICEPPTEPVLAASQAQRSRPEATDILQAFNAWLSIMTQIVVDEGGVLNHIFGETAVALFGLLPSQQPAADQAVYAARRLMRKFHSFAQGEAQSSIHNLGLGTGITTGNAASAMIRTQHYSAVNATGSSVHRAMQLAELLQVHQILIDQATLEQLGQDGSAFFPYVAPQSRDGEALYFQAVNL